MPTTPRGIVTPSQSDPPNAPGQMQVMADTIDAALDDIEGTVDNAYASPTLVVFTSSGSFSKGSYAGARKVRVICVGGGGAGGGAPATTSGNSIGAGGGSGGYSESVIDMDSLASSVTVTIGAGGTGASGTTGGNGGTTSFGAHVVANGGNGGGVSTSQATPAAGGTAGTGQIAIPGNASQWCGLGATGVRIASSGAPGPWGGGGAAANQATGGAGSRGGGGGGTSNGSSQSARTGGAGGAGIVIVEVY